MRTVLWEKTTDKHVEEIDQYFSGRSIDVVEVFVLERESGGLSGFIEINVRNFAEGSRSKEVPYIEAWYIDPNARGKGLGRKLVDAAVTWALDKGYRELASDAELENSEGIAAHIALGFEEVDRVVCFLRKLT